MTSPVPERLFLKSCTLATWTLGLLFTGFFVSELARSLFIDAPLNFYEPELAIEAWALSVGQQTHPPYETGPFSGLYAPLFQVIGALLFQIFGPSMIVLRLVSIGSVVICAELLHRMAALPYRYSRLLWFGGLFMWHGTVVGFDFHAKPDSLGAMLGLAALFTALRHARNPGDVRFTVAGALLAALAVTAKQPMLFIVAAIGSTLVFYRQFRQFFLFTGVFAIASALLWWGFTMLCGPMLLHNSFVVPGQYPIRFGVLADSLNVTLSGPWLLLALVMAVNRYRAGFWEITDSMLLAALFWSLPASLLTAAKTGGMNNAFQPFFYCLMLLIARNTWLFYAYTAEFWKGSLRTVSLLLLMVLVFATAGINIPSEITRSRQLVAYRQAYNSAVNRIRTERGPVFIPMDNYLALRGGKPRNYSIKSEWDVFPVAIQNPAIRHSVTIASKANLVVTHRYSTWYNPDAFETMLAAGGFHKESESVLDYNLVIAYWRK